MNKKEGVELRTRALLDCTLRDGGYVNNWDFGRDQILEIFDRLVDAKIDYIEVGFLDEREAFNENRTIQPDTMSYNRLFAGADKGNSIILAMIDYGTCGIEKLQPVQYSFLDGIRVIFKEHLRDEALAFCKKVKDLGYLVFAQMVSVTTYTDEALVEYAEACNKIMPYATSMVDTYGLLDEEHLMHIFAILDAHLAPEIREGFHAHNNFQLGFANAKCFLNSESKRDLLADGTLYGMGKSAGNAPLELLMMWCNEKFKTSYEISQALEAIDNVLMDIYQKKYWGYSSFFFMASSTACHPNYVNFFMSKKTLSMTQIHEILEKIQSNKKLLFDKEYAEACYLDYQLHECDDAVDFLKLSELLSDQKILLLGPGRNLKKQKAKVDAYIKCNNPIVIAVNYMPNDFEVNYLFVTKTKRYGELRRSWKIGNNCKAKIIATSNVVAMGHDFSYILNYGDYIDRDTEIIDNSFVMLLRFLQKLRVKDIIAAGFDGYSKRTDNYFDVRREYGFAKEKADYLNRYVSAFLKQYSLNIHFITNSKYHKIRR